ncbi:sporulation integral membrane protein YtvI [Erysipelothrix aquatica]|uniref:sporulation integral membrane protein YtvI n=1 Tax=Erysipelothrix aquatica TaxID=2683714 RepID=UPI00135ABD04|nr:sporulation integral membrane protein YtvI [Erysipelothrix aquatica]
MTLEEKKRFIINFVFYTLIAGLAFLVFKFSVKYLTPFIIGFVIASLLKPIILKLVKMFGENKYLRIGVIVVFYIIVGIVIFGLTLAAISGIQGVVKHAPTYVESTLIPALTSIFNYVESLFEHINPEILSNLSEVTNAISKQIQQLAGTVSTSAISFLTRFVSSLPNLFISILIAIISSFFFTLDYKNVVDTVLAYLPQRWVQFMYDVKGGFFDTVGKYMKAYAKLMTLTFIELSIGFALIGVGNPIGLAFMISIVDILPVLGTGTVMIPWTIIELVMGNFERAIGLFVIYVVITVIRNILEPKVVGDQIGLHPLVTLICIFVGMRLAGIIGLFGLPILVTILKTLHDEGKIQFFKKFEKRELPQSIEK